jgi:GntR family transcriptional repressor for pyruvate dehydrogenase complex
VTGVAQADRATGENGPGAAAGDLPRLTPIRVERAPKKGASAARSLAQYIIGNAIEPGTTLPPLKALSEQFGLGRGTMNDALQLLEAYGLLEMRPGRYGGPVVRRPDPSDLASSLTLAFYANSSSLMDIMDAREVIEPALAGMAARRITVDELDALRDSVAIMRARDTPPRRAVEEADRFHGIVFQAAGSPVLRLLAEGLHQIVTARAKATRYAEAELLAVADAHDSIIEALNRRDELEASARWHEHTKMSGAHYENASPAEARAPVVWSI